jgi:GGDEF domain-containing protein
VRAGEAVRRSVRATDTCAAVDFDRFGILLPHASLAGALPVAERMRANLARDGISASIGVADAAGTAGLTDVRAAAEDALYAALAETPRGAIGRPPGAVPPARTRSFPGAPAEARDGERAAGARPGSGRADDNVLALLSGTISDRSD